MHQTATRHDFHQLSDAQQEKYEGLLKCLDDLQLSCRCEMVGKDFTIIVAPGFSSPRHWMNRFDIKPEN